MNQRFFFSVSLLAPLLATGLAHAAPPVPAEKPPETVTITPETPARAAPPTTPAATSTITPEGAIETAPATAPLVDAAEPTAAPARAAVQPLSSPLHTVSHWYGWQTLATDGASLVLLVAALNHAPSDGGTPLAFLSMGAYVGGGPIVHFAHGNFGRGLGSLALRAGLPIVAAFAGARISGADCGEFCGFGGVLLGGLAGIAGAVAIDAAALGYERVPVRASAWPIVGVAADGKSTLVTAQGRF